MTPEEEKRFYPKRSMVFTDDDLGRLKTELETNYSGITHYNDRDNLKALLARLEAAELCMLLKNFHEPHGWCICEQCKAFKAWRKAAGK